MGGDCSKIENCEIIEGKLEYDITALVMLGGEVSTLVDSWMSVSVLDLLAWETVTGAMGPWSSLMVLLTPSSLVSSLAIS